MANWLDFIKSNKKEVENNNNNNVLDSTPIKITSTFQYRLELEKGETEFDFSELNLEFQDIQHLNLENLNLEIDLRKVFIPYNGRALFGRHIIVPFCIPGNTDYFLKIYNSRLSGNNVKGDLSLFEGEKNLKPVYIWYSEETFDEKYKSQYPQFFISKEAPEELRDKYYNPKKIYKNNETDADDRVTEKKELIALKRHTLTFNEYLKYYEFLNGKYLGNFEISKQDLLQIEIVEKYGLEQRDKIYNYITNIINDINQNANCEKYTINKVDDNGINLTLQLKLKK